LGHFGPNIGNFGKSGQMSLLLSFAALSVIFCVSRFTNTISWWQESQNRFKLINLVLSAILEILENSDISVILVL
jgi:hypothetical protein